MDWEILISTIIRGLPDSMVERKLVLTLLLQILPEDHARRPWIKQLLWHLEKHAEQIDLALGEE